MDTDTMQDMECPLCGSKRFKDFRKRKQVQCADCSSLPRTRASWLALRDYAKLKANARVAHFAPEAALARCLNNLCGKGYEPYDFDPKRYQPQLPFTAVSACNLCDSLSSFQAGAYDAIVHNHVLEHLPCNYTIVLLRLHALLKPGGVHVFSVPVLKGYTKSDLRPSLSADTRIKEFGHPEHVRYFGTEDHDQNLGMVFGQTMESYRLEDYINSSTLLRANVLPPTWRASGEGVFVVAKV